MPLFQHFRRGADSPNIVRGVKYTNTKILDFPQILYEPLVMMKDSQLRFPHLSFILSHNTSHVY